PYSLVMALTALTRHADTIETSIRRVEKLPGDKTEFNKQLGDSMGKLRRIVTIALERLDVELGRLDLTKTPDADTQEVSRRLRDVLQNSPPDPPGGARPE